MRKWLIRITNEVGIPSEMPLGKKKKKKLFFCELLSTGLGMKVCLHFPFYNWEPVWLRPGHLWGERDLITAEGGETIIKLHCMKNIYFQWRKELKMKRIQINNREKEGRFETTRWEASYSSKPWGFTENDKDVNWYFEDNNTHRGKEPAVHLWQVSHCSINPSTMQDNMKTFLSAI